MLRVLSLPQLELYPKLCMRTSLNPLSYGSHFLGQKRDGSKDLVYVLREPPPSLWTKTRSATTDSRGSKSVFSPQGPLESSDSVLPLSSRLANVRVRNERFGEVGSMV